MDRRQEIFEKIEDIFEICDRRNIGSNEAELDTKETITDYIYKNFSLNGVGCSLPSKIEVNFDGNLLAEIETTDKKLKFLRAVNGYGEAVNVAKIQVVKKQANYYQRVAI